MADPQPDVSQLDVSQLDVPNSDLPRLTLEHVARVAGVSRATVSRVVNGVSSVDPRLRQVVEQAIATTGYVPNAAARALVTRRTGTIVLVVSEAEQRGIDEPFVGRMFTDPYFGRIVTGLLRVLRPEGVQLMLMLADDAQTRTQVLAYLRQGHVDGVILVTTHAADPMPQALLASGLPVVLAGRPKRPLTISNVDAEQRKGAVLATEHLLARGCRRLATISGPLDMPAGRDRLAGFVDTLTIHRLPSAPSVPGDFTLESGERAMIQLLDEHPDLDGVFVASDLMAQGALLVMRDRGIAVPDQIAVVGFDDSSAALACRPPLTTVRTPTEDMAGEMARLLIAHIGNSGRPTSSVSFDVNLVVRESA